MNKKFKNLFLAGALVLGFAGVAVSCTDYDDDIKSLQDQIDKKGTEISTLQSTVNSLQSAIQAGAVITSVTAISGEPGGWTFTLSDGKSYNVTNGAKGADGTPGAAGKDGKWYTPNAETGNWDVHEIIDGTETVTDTKQSYLPKNATTIKYDAEANTLVVTEGEEEYKISLVATGESGLVFIPNAYIDGIEGVQVTSLYYNPLEIGLKSDKSTLNSKDEIWTIVQEDVLDKNGKKTGTKDKLVQVPIAAKAQYHVNISDFEFDDTYEYKFIYKDVPYIQTREASSKDFAMDATFDSYKDGILTVAIAVTGTEAAGEDVTRFALQVTKDGKTVTSDYATLLSNEMRDVKIADPKKEAEAKTDKKIKDEHYRRGGKGISVADDEAAYIASLGGSAAWVTGLTTLEAAHATCDTAVAYDGSIDLKSIVAAHFTRVTNAGTAGEDSEMSAADLEAAGLKFVYEVVKNYRIGSPVTDQADFVNLNGSVFTPKTYDTEGTAAIGRTPIIRVKLVCGEDIVQVAYIKVYIAKRIDPNAQFTLVPVRQDGNKKLTQGENIFRFFCDGDQLMTTVKDMNQVVYNGVNMSKDLFHISYDALKAQPSPAMKDKDGKTLKDPIGTIEDVVVDPVEGTHVFAWTLTDDELWAYAGKEVSVIARYYSSKNESLYVDILLTATVDDFAKAVALNSAKGDYIDNYWTEGFTATKYNVNTPSAKDSSNSVAKCIFQNDINAPFVTEPKKVDGTENPNAGKLVVSGIASIDKVEYFFCTDHIVGVEKKIDGITKIGNLNVKFSVSEDGTELSAQIVSADGKKEFTEMEKIATINNEKQTKGETTVWNMFTYEKGTTVADTLLNTGEMFTYIGATAYLCPAEGGEYRELPVTFDGKDHFRANIIRPVTITSKSKGSFVDAVTFGKEGTYIKIEDLLDPVDWRAISFADETILWGYYGPFEVVIDEDGAECDLNGKRQAIPKTIILKQTKAGDTKTTDPLTGTEFDLPENTSGFLMYKNNGTNVTKDFNLYVKAKVKYGFGYIDTDWITVPVAKTIGQ